MFHGKRIVVVMPAYNAERTLERTVSEVPLDIVDETDRRHPRIAYPYSFSLGPDLAIHKIYDGGWFVGRPTLEELRQGPARDDARVSPRLTDAAPVRTR